MARYGRTCSGSQSFFLAAENVWNSLPVDMRSVTDNAAFKRSLKTFYFNEHFSIQLYVAVLQPPAPPIALFGSTMPRYRFSIVLYCIVQDMVVNVQDIFVNLAGILVNGRMWS